LIHPTVWPDVTDRTGQTGQMDRAAADWMSAILSHMVWP